MTDFAAARTHMVDSQIHTAGVIMPEILNAFGTVPRELFMPEAMRGVAYADEDLPVGEGRFLLEPITHARMIQAAAPRPDDVVLDIGGATGYSAAILSSMATTVMAVEENQNLLDQAVRLWEQLGVCNIVSYCAKLTKGNPENAPFNLIFMNGAVTAIPENIVAQLAPGGRLMVIVKNPGAVMGEATLVEAGAAGGYSSCSLFSAGAAYLPGFEPKPSFRF